MLPTGDAGDEPRGAAAPVCRPCLPGDLVAQRVFEPGVVGAEEVRGGRRSVVLEASAGLAGWRGMMRQGSVSIKLTRRFSVIRPEVSDFVALGKLPSEMGAPDAALEEAVDHAGTLLDLIERPVTDEEAEVLAECFGEDLCFGVAWGLRHLIETAPSARERQPEALRRWREGLSKL